MDSSDDSRTVDPALDACAPGAHAPRPVEPLAASPPPDITKEGNDAAQKLRSINEELTKVNVELKSGWTSWPARTATSIA